MAETAGITCPKPPQWRFAEALCISSCFNLAKHYIIRLTYTRVTANVKKSQ